MPAMAALGLPWLYPGRSHSTGRRVGSRSCCSCSPSEQQDCWQRHCMRLKPRSRWQQLPAAHGAGAARGQCQLLTATVALGQMLFQPGGCSVRQKRREAASKSLIKSVCESPLQARALRARQSQGLAPACTPGGDWPLSWRWLFCFMYSCEGPGDPSTKSLLLVHLLCWSQHVLAML